MNKDANNLNKQSNLNNNFIYRNLNNYSKNSIDEGDFEYDFKPDNLHNNAFINKTSSQFIPQRMDSRNSNLDYQYQFSIDSPNIPKQRLQQYLNDDVLNALDHPSVSRLNTKISDINSNEFNLFSQPNNSNVLEQNYNIQKPNMNTNNNFNNYNNSSNNNNQTSNNNYTQLNLNAKPFIPVKFRKNAQHQNDIKMNLQKNKGNKFDNYNNNEVKNNDWRCNQCKNLNFAFINFCNRCQFPRELLNSSEFNNVYMPQQYY